MKLVLKEDLKLTSVEREKLIGFIKECHPEATETEVNQLIQFNDFEIASIAYVAQDSKKLAIHEKQKEESNNLAQKEIRKFISLAKKRKTPCYICKKYDYSSLDFKLLDKRNIPYDKKGLMKGSNKEAPTVREELYDADGNKVFRYRHPSCMPPITSKDVIEGLLLEGDEAQKIHEFAEAFEINQSN